jgi:hypothetical protein
MFNATYGDLQIAPTPPTEKNMGGMVLARAPERNRPGYPVAGLYVVLVVIPLVNRASKSAASRTTAITSSGKNRYLAG